MEDRIGIYANHNAFIDWTDEPFELENNNEDD